jgi:hypothetical protein
MLNQDGREGEIKWNRIGLRENMLCVCTTDNGPWPQRGQSTLLNQPNTLKAKHLNEKPEKFILTTRQLQVRSHQKFLQELYCPLYTLAGESFCKWLAHTWLTLTHTRGWLATSRPPNLFCEVISPLFANGHDFMCDWLQLSGIELISAWGIMEWSPPPLLTTEIRKKCLIA